LSPGVSDVANWIVTSITTRGWNLNNPLRGDGYPKARSPRPGGARLQDFGCVSGRAEALLGQGRCLISLEKRGAEEPLAEAHDLFASMGHRAGLAEAENLLAVGPPQ
jgi:hypothetical protein